jgi:hypothetical protein
MTCCQDLVYDVISNIEASMDCSGLRRGSQCSSRACCQGLGGKIEPGWSWAGGDGARRRGQPGGHVRAGMGHSWTGGRRARHGGVHGLRLARRFAGGGALQPRVLALVRCLRGRSPAPPWRPTTSRSGLCCAPSTPATGRGSSRRGPKAPLRSSAGSVPGVLGKSSHCGCLGCLDPNQKHPLELSGPARLACAVDRMDCRHISAIRVDRGRGG